MSASKEKRWSDSYTIVENVYILEKSIHCRLLFYCGQREKMSASSSFSATDYAHCVNCEQPNWGKWAHTALSVRPVLFTLNVLPFFLRVKDESLFAVNSFKGIGQANTYVYVCVYTHTVLPRIYTENSAALWSVKFQGKYLKRLWKKSYWYQMHL